jgi:hypothetical protein
MLSFQRARAPELTLAVSAPRLDVERKRAEPVGYVEGLAGSLSLEGADLTQSLPLGAARLAIGRIHADSLSPLAPDGTKLSGALDGTFEAARSRTSELMGGVRFEVRRGELSHTNLGIAANVKSDLSWSRGADPQAPLEVRRLDVQLLAASVRSGARRSKGFDARIEGAGLRLIPAGGASAGGTLRARISSADALLPLVLGGPLKEITSTALNLKQLDAETNVKISRSGVGLRVVEARSGNLRARGYFEQEKSEPRGAFLLSSGPLNVGVTLSGGETEISPFVGDGWLSATWPRISAPAAAPGPS